MVSMLLAGEIDAAIGASGVDAPEIIPLIPEARTAAITHFQHTGIYPISHLVVHPVRHPTAHAGLPRCAPAGGRQTRRPAVCARAWAGEVEDCARDQQRGADAEADVRQRRRRARRCLVLAAPVLLLVLRPFIRVKEEGREG